MRIFGFYVCSGGDAKQVFFCRRLYKPWQKLQGLLGAGKDADMVYLEKCHSIHTCFMRMPLDIAWVDTTGVILSSERCVPAWRLRSCLDAVGVFERPASEKPWFCVGETLGVIYKEYERK